MTLKLGAPAPEIHATTTAGDDFVLSQQMGVCTVVYFYPRAFTPGCTRETKQFSTDYNELYLAGANIVGVSTDDGSTQCRFAEDLGIPFPLIADSDKQISKAYGVLWPLLGMAKRVTYIIDAKMRVVANFHHELRIDKHREDVLRFVRQMASA
jgi:peroxiredoxin